MAPSVPNLRSKQLAPVVIKALAAGSESFGFRLVHYSVQSNHCHFIIEAPSSAVLARGMKGLCVRLARAINRQRGVKGRVFADRYHEHVLRTPRETRLALAYVLNNFRKHNPAADRVAFDPLASSAAFDGWKGHAVANDDGARRGVSTVAARCWLLQAGWRKHGLISPREVPSYKPAAVKKVAP